MMPLKFGNRASGSALRDRDHRGQRRRHLHRRAVRRPLPRHRRASPISTEFSAVAVRNIEQLGDHRRQHPARPVGRQVAGDHQIEPGALHAPRRAPPRSAPDRRRPDPHRRRAPPSRRPSRGPCARSRPQTRRRHRQHHDLGVRHACPRTHSATSSARSPISSSTVSLAPRSARPVSRLQLAIPVRVRDLLDQDDDLHHAPLLRRIESMGVAVVAECSGRAPCHAPRDDRLPWNSAEGRSTMPSPDRCPSIRSPRRSASGSAHGWTDAAPGMSAVTSIIRAQQLHAGAHRRGPQALRAVVRPVRDAAPARLHPRGTDADGQRHRAAAGAPDQRHEHRRPARARRLWSSASRTRSTAVPRCSCSPTSGRELVERATRALNTEVFAEPRLVGRRHGRAGRGSSRGSARTPATSPIPGRSPTRSDASPGVATPPARRPDSGATETEVNALQSRGARCCLAVFEARSRGAQRFWKSGARFSRKAAMPFLLVGGVEQRREDVLLEAQALGERGLHRGVQRRLRGVHRRQRLRRRSCRRPCRPPRAGRRPGRPARRVRRARPPRHPSSVRSARSSAAL